jgi:K(+)-stimulated pyrophosphate-energized sodium pump
LLSLLVVYRSFAVFLARQVIAKDTGTPKMREISDAIKEGAEAFLSRQNRTIVSLSAALALLIFLLYAFVRTPSKADPAPPLELAFWTTLAFVLGAACSVIAGYVGMWVSIRANIRTAAAVRSSLNEGLQIAMRGGAVSGLFVVAMSLLGVGGLRPA